MAKHFASLFFTIAVSLLAGCVIVPMAPRPATQLDNAVTGAVAGGILGALIGDSRKAAGIGALIGTGIGAGVPVQQGYPVYGQTFHGGAPGMTVSCPPGSYWAGRVCRTVNHQPGITNNQFQFHGNAVCGPAAYSMACPSVPIPGTNCRRCQ